MSETSVQREKPPRPGDEDGELDFTPQPIWSPVRPDWVRPYWVLDAEDLARRLRFVAKSP